MVNALNQYRTYQVDTANREDFVALLYDGARRFTAKALSALEAGRLSEVSLYTGKAQRIFTELTVSLNYDAGEISTNLAKLYDYWSWRLSQGLIKRDPQAFREVSETLVDMHAAWVEAARQVRAARGTHSGV